MQSLAATILHEIDVNFSFVKQLIKEQRQVELVCALFAAMAAVLSFDNDTNLHMDVLQLTPMYWPSTNNCGTSISSDCIRSRISC